MDEIKTEYPAKLRLNGRLFSRVLIDQHYRKRHSESIRDHLILELLSVIDGKYFPIAMHRNGFDYLVIEPAMRNGLPYRLVLVTKPGDDFIGVVNAFRIKRSKK